MTSVSKRRGLPPDRGGPSRPADARRQASARCGAEPVADREARKGAGEAGERDRPVRHRAAVDATHLGAEGRSRSCPPARGGCAAAPDGRAASSPRSARAMCARGRQHGGVLARAVVMQRRGRCARRGSARARSAACIGSCVPQPSAVGGETGALQHRAATSRRGRLRAGMRGAGEAISGAPKPKRSAAPRLDEREGLQRLDRRAREDRARRCRRRPATISPSARTTAMAPACALSTRRPRVSSMRTGFCILRDALTNARDGPPKPYPRPLDDIQYCAHPAPTRGRLRRRTCGEGGVQVGSAVTQTRAEVGPSAAGEYPGGPPRSRRRPSQLDVTAQNPARGGELPLMSCNMDCGVSLPRSPSVL